MYTWINYQELYCTRKLTDAIDFITTSIRKGVGPKSILPCFLCFAKKERNWGIEIRCVYNVYK